MRRHRRRALALILALLPVTAAADELTTTTNQKYRGQLVAVDAKGVTFDTGGTKRAFPSQGILLVDFGHPVMAPAAGSRYVEIELTDGSVLRCSKFLIKDKAFEVELLPGPKGMPEPTFQLPMGVVFSALRRAEDPRTRDAWRQVLQNRGKRDLYVTRQNDRMDFIAGTVIQGSPKGDLITFERDDGTRTDLLLSRATGGLVFNQTLPPDVPPTVCKVVDVFGNSWVVRSVELTAAGMMVTTVSGVKVTYPTRNAVAKLDYAQGNITYLSDLTPEVVAPKFTEGEVQTTFLSDRPLYQEKLKLDQHPVPKGLWVRVPYDELVLTYPLNGDYREFKTTAGIVLPEDATRAPQSAGIKFTVEADGRVLYSNGIRAGEKPRTLSVDVKGAKELRLTIEPLARFQYTATTLVLAEARVQK